jgi:predicted TIM-barrel fold metal-dependent hydrolase
VLDAHCHVLPEGADGAGAFVMYRGDASGYLELASAMGIDRTALMSWNGPIASDLERGNDVVEEAVGRHPDRFLGVAYVNPAAASREEPVAALERYVGELGFAGVKPY